MQRAYLCFDRTERILFLIGLCLLVFVGMTRSTVTAQQPTPTPPASSSVASLIPMRVTNLNRITTLAQYGTGWARQVAWSPDGNILAAATTHGLWLYTAPGSSRHDWQKMADAKPVVVEDYTGTSTSVAISRDGRYIAAGSDDQAVRVWDLNTRKLLRTFTGHSDFVSSVVFVGDSPTLVSGSTDGTVRLWDVQSNKLKNVIKGAGRGAISLATNGDGTMLVIGHFSGAVQVWDMVANRQKQAFHVGEISLMALNAQGTQLITGYRGGMWITALENNPSDMQEVIPWEYTRDNGIHIQTASFSPDGTTLAWAGEQTKLGVWNLNEKKLVFSSDGHEVIPDYVSIAHNPAGDLLAAAIGGQGAISLLDATSGETVVTLSGLGGSVGQFVFMPDGASLLIGESDGLKTLVLDTGERKFAHSTEFVEAPRTLLFSPDHATLLLTGLAKLNGNAAYVLDAKTLATVATLTPPDRYVYETGVYTLDDKWIVTGNVHNFDFWDARTFIYKKSYHACKPTQPTLFPSSSLHISPDGSTLAFTCWNENEQYLRFMDIQSGKADDVPIDEHTGTFDTIYSPDGKMVAVTAYRGRIYLIDAKTHQARAILTTGGESPISAAFSPDGSLLAIGTGNGTVQLWNVAARTNRILFSFRHFGIMWAACPSYSSDADCRGDGHSINAIAFNASGTLLVTSSGDGIVRLFGIAAS